MSRTLGSIEAIVLPSVLALGLTGCGSKTPGAPIGHTGDVASGGELAVTLAAPADGVDATRTLAPASGGHFPAVSTSGTLVVDLVLDAEDFSGIPIATVVFWDRTGAVESHRLVSELTEETSAGQAQLEEAAVAQINARLDASRWLPLDKVSATGESEDTGAPDTLMVDGVTITLAQIADRFPPPGTLPAEMGGGCGDIIGLGDGFGSRQLGFAVVFPRVNLGGDDCFGTPNAELAIVVPLS